MLRIRVLAALTAVLSLALAAPAVAADASRTSTRGRWIVDGAGRALLARGINVVAKRPPYTPASIGFGSDDAAFLQRNGFDAVRLGVLYAGVEPRPGAYDDGYLASIARTIAVLHRHHIRALLDFHQDMYNERYQGEGFPDWAALDDGLPAEPKAGFPGNYLAMPALQRAEDNFYANASGPGGVGLVDRYAAAWRHVAARFARTPGVMGYDLINEPLPGTAPVACLADGGCPAFEQQRLAPFYAKVTAAIRAVDRATPVSYEVPGTFGSGGGTSLPRLADRHAIFGWHLYCPQSTTGPDDSASKASCPAFEERQFGRADAHSARREPQLLSEFGSTVQTSTIGRVQDEADRHLVGWMEWTYFSNGITDTGGTPNLVEDPHRPPTGANVEAAQLAALRRPHATAVAGTPTRVAYDAATRAFVLRFTPRRAVAAPTRILVPAGAYPAGHRVTVRGGRVLRDAHGIVDVRARGRAPVTIRVTPRR
ncbi:MAG: cellulase family glycosylhydrolase [Solirubrobacteraceae bacterium]